MKTSEVVKKLNELLEIDKQSLTKLVNYRVNFDDKILDSDIDFIAGIDAKMGIIGVINGLLDDGMTIAAAIDDDGEVLFFQEMEKNDPSGEVV